MIGVDNAAVAINRTLLRSTLRKYISALGLGTEDVVCLEYSPSVKEPQSAGSAAVDDWVAALAAGDTLMAAGLYDGCVMIGRHASLSGVDGGEVAPAFPLRISAHVGPVSGVSLHDGHGATGSVMATAGQDAVVRLWAIPGVASTGRLACNQVAELTGASDALFCVAIDPLGQTVASGDARGTVLLWAATGHDSGADQHADGGGAGSKRPRSSAASASSTPRVVLPLHSVSGRHNGRVSGVAWLSPSQLVTGSWDHTAVIWDVSDDAAAAAPVPVTVLRTGKVITSITCSPMGSSVATGHPDNCVRVWDARGRAGKDAASSTSLEAAGLKSTAAGAGGWVSSVAWCPASAHYLAATCYDGTSLLWDLRAPSAPLHTLTKHGDKALSVAWVGTGDAAGSVITGGADKQVRCARSGIVPSIDVV